MFGIIGKGIKVIKGWKSLTNLEKTTKNRACYG